MNHFVKTAAAVAAIACTGCATPHVVVPPPPAITAPDAERVAWAERYNLVAGTVAGDTIGTGEVVYNLKDLSVGVSNPIIQHQLEQLDELNTVRGISAILVVATAVTTVAGLVVTPNVEETYGVDATVSRGFNIGTTVSLVGFIASSLWSNSINNSLEQIRGRVRLVYGHAIEEELNVEIHPNGKVTARPPLTTAAAATTTTTTTPPAPVTDPVPPVLTPPVETPATTTTAPPSP